MHIALLLVLAAAPSTTQSWRFDTNSHPEVSISNVNGSIRVEATDDKGVSVEMTQEGSEEVRARTPVEVKQDGDEVSVSLSCGSMKKRRHACEDPAPTHFVVKVPRDAELDLSAVNASVKVSGVRGEQEVTSVNGEISLEGSRSKLDITSVAGAVFLRPEALARTEVSTVSGAVKLQLPRGAGAQVEFSSVSGRLNGSDASLGSVERRYGNGEHPVEVSTVSGSLDIQGDEATK